MKIITATALALGLGVSAAAADEPTNLLDAFKAWTDSYKNEDGEYDRAGSSNPTVAETFGIDTSNYGARKTGGSDSDDGIGGLFN